MSNGFEKKESPFKITIDRQVIKLLGAHLYGDTPSVINELVANSYDAGAKRIWISIKTTSPYQIMVQDDGIGMTLDEVNNYYLNIGYNRRTQNTLQSELKENGVNRPDMGQKGIGKLAVFALSKQVRLISVKNGNAVGCYMDFDVICQKDGQPSTFDITAYDFSKDKLSEAGSGTLIILENVVKDLSKSYKYIASNLARSFILNNDDIEIYIQRNQEGFKRIQRADLDYTRHMDVFATIGDGFDELKKQVENNSIEKKYKTLFSYEDMVAETISASSNKRFDALPVNIKVFDKDKKNQVAFDFSFKGWIGTVKDEGAFKSLLGSEGYSDEEIKDKNIIVVDDNRISVYSRGKVGEYNILPKIKTKAANDAYIIGEIFVDDFENDLLIDMATSNRRGYQEDDPRYEVLCKNLKLFVSRIVSAKQRVNKIRKEDEEKAEAEQIKDDFEKGHIKSKNTFDKMSEEDKKAIEEDHKQFARAVTLSSQGRDSSEKKKILISHRQVELKEYGNFLIDILIQLNPDLSDRIVFTSNPKYGLPKGKDLFESLKECFRPDFYVVFLFTKSFYDSNVCLAEAGAAWATNTQYMNLVVDIPFKEIDNPLDRNNNGARFRFNTADEIDEFVYVVQTIMINVDKEYAFEDIKKIVIEELKNNGAKLALPPYLPKRKYQMVPVCKICRKPMIPYVNSKGKIFYKCVNTKHNKFSATIK